MAVFPGSNSVASFLAGLIGPPTPSPDGGMATGRFGRNGDLINSILQPYYYEQTKRGNTFSLSLGATSTAIAAGQVVGAAAATSVQFAVWNPTNSGVDMVITKFMPGFISGTLPVAPIYHSVFNASGVTSVQNTAPVPSYGGVGRGSAMQGWTSAGGAPILGAGKAATLKLSAINFTAGTLGQLYPINVEELIDGDIIIPPGYGYQPMWASAAALLGTYSLTWFEVAA